MLHGAFGTLGIITKIKFKLIEAKKFVSVEYYNYPNLEDYLQAIYTEYKNPKYDFMDGIIHNDKNYVLCLGKFVDEVPYYNTYTWNVYYKSTLKKKKDYLPTYDYFFRYDADCHWSTRNYYLDNEIVRFLIGPILSSFILGSNNIIKLANNPIVKKLFPRENRPDVIVDVFIPFEKINEFYNWYKAQFNYYPVWIVPYFVKKIYPWINPNHLKSLKDNLFIDFAIYGFKQPNDAKNYYKLLEDEVKELKGIKTLISHNYYDEKSFWEIYNKELYDKVRKEVNPYNIFQNIFDKMVKG